MRRGPCREFLKTYQKWGDEAESGKDSVTAHLGAWRWILKQLCALGNCLERARWTLPWIGEWEAGVAQWAEQRHGLCLILNIGAAVCQGLKEAV